MDNSLIRTQHLKIDLHRAICSLAEALSLVGIDNRQHGERVAYMAERCAVRLGWSEERISDLFHAGLLHDCGVSSTRIHKKLVGELDWAGSDDHCVIGEGLLSGFRPLSHLATTIRYHHTHWESLRHINISEEERLMSNLIYLVDRVDALLAAQSERDIVNGGERVREKIGEFKGTLFAPRLVDAFLEASSNEAYWLNLEPLNLLEYIARFRTPTVMEIDSEEDLRALAFIFARIVDAKSPYTYEHSQGVARLSVFLARSMKLPPASLFKIEIAALLHDLGKLGVPDEILEKRGPLTHDEKIIMHRHSYDTYRILRQIGGFEEISEWAGNHHETLIGDGYPFQKDRGNLGPEARIIAVADIFQALAQNRPYRNTLNPGEIIDLLFLLAEEGKVDQDIVRLASEERETCWRIAVGQD